LSLRKAHIKKCTTCGKTFRCKAGRKSAGVCKLGSLFMKGRCNCAQCCLNNDGGFAFEKGFENFKEIYGNCFFLTKRLKDEWIMRRMVR
jgi:hypothetical protein